MEIELLLIMATMVIAMVGIFWRDPTEKMKIFLAVLTIATGGAAIAKASSDDKDKELLQDLAIGSTALPNARYDDLVDVVKREYGEKAIANCLHWTIGMVCNWGPTADNKEQVLVLDRYEAAEIYSKLKRQGSLSKLLGFDNAVDKLKEITGKKYSPNTFSEAFWDKLAVLAFLTYYDHCRRMPDYYTYHKKDGISLKIPNGPVINIATTEQIDDKKESNNLKLFGIYIKELESQIRAKAKGPDCPGV